jgi:uncharacterized protein (TIRG00374 family)
MRVGWRAAAGLAVSALLLWWALRDVSLSAVAGELSRSDATLFALAAAAATAIFALRALRWQAILKPVDSRVHFGPAWRATTIGMMINNVVPARAGELARAYALTREVPAIPLASSVASLAVDRVFDALVLLLLGLVALLDPALPTTAQIAGRSIDGWAGAGALLVAALLAALYLVIAFPSVMIAVYELFTRRLSRTLEERGRSALRAFSAGLGALRSPKAFAVVFAWTVAHWLLNSLAFWLGFRAVGIDVPFTATFLVQAFIAFGVAIPAAPGFFGVFEALAVASLGLYGVDRASAVSFAIGFHVVSFIPVTVLGAYYATRLGLGLRGLEAPPAAGS